MLRAIAWHAWGRGARRTAGDGNLRRNLKETSYTFTGITNAPLAIRVTARSRIATLAHAKLRIRNAERIFIILSHLSARLNCPLNYRAC